MLCARKMMALCAAVVLVGMAGCGADRVESLKIEPTAMTIHTTAPVSPFTVTAYNAKGEEVVAPTIAWASSDTMVIGVDQTGRLTPAKSGKAIINVASGNAKADVPVTVTLYTSITLADSALQLSVGEARQLMAQILDENGNPVEGMVMWEGSDKAVAEVTADGMVTAMAPGQVNIMASVKGVPGVALPVTIVAPKPAPKVRAR